MDGNSDVRGPIAISLFISSPGDVLPERDAATRVVQRINEEQKGVLAIKDIRWESSYYGAHDTFQKQIVESAECDLVVCIFWRRLGSELPPDFPQRMSDGRPYPSGTVYELLTALEARNKGDTPDVWVYKKYQTEFGSIQDSKELARRLEQWNALEDFWKEFFVNSQGHFTAAYNSFTATDEFEAVFEKHLRDWLDDRGLLQARVVWPVSEKGSPFRGLESFDVEHERVMFGRTRLAERAIEFLQSRGERGKPFLLLVGESGSGKSSLARAAVLPRILRLTGEGPGRADMWRMARFTVSASEDPALALANALFSGECLPELKDSDFKMPSALAAVMNSGVEIGLAPVFRALERAAGNFRSANNFDRPAVANLALLLDQFEAILALPPAEQERFAALLNGLAVSGHVVLVATLRSDRYDAFCRVSGFLDLKTAGVMIDVPMPGLAEIGDIVRKPAEAAGLAYEGDARTGEGLDDRLIAAAAGRDALPLLQFTLEKLFEAMVARLADRGAGLASASRQDLVLRWEDYNALGGLEGAIGLVADQAYWALDTDAQATLPRLIRVLVQGAEHSLVSEAAVRDDITKDEAMARLVGALEERRILVAGSRTAGDGTPHATVRFAHEAVLRGWPVLRNLIAANENFFRIREEIVAAERRWQDAGAPDDRLIPAGLPLVEAQSLVQDFGTELPEAIVAYVAASAEKDAQRRDRELREAQRLANAQKQVAQRTRVGLIAASILAIAASGAALFGWIKRSEAVQQAQIAERQTGLAREQTRQALEQKAIAQTRESLRLASEARQLLKTGDVSMAMQLALRGLPSPSDNRPIVPEALSVLTEANALHLERRSLGLGTGGWFVNPNADRALVPSGGGVELHDLERQKVILRLDGAYFTGAMVKKGFIDDEIAAANVASGIVLIDVRNGKQLGELRGHEKRVIDFDLSASRQRAVSMDSTRNIRLWDVPGKRQLASIGGIGNLVRRFQFSRDSKRLFVLTDAAVLCLDAMTGNKLGELHGSPRGPVFFAISEDDRFMLIGDFDGGAHVWNLQTFAADHTLPRRNSPAHRGAIDRNAGRAAIAWVDGAVRIWDFRTGRVTEHAAPAGSWKWRCQLGRCFREIAEVATSSSVIHLQFTPGGRHLALIWDIKTERSKFSALQLLAIADSRVMIVIEEKLLGDGTRSMVRAADSEHMAFMTASGRILLLDDSIERRNHTLPMQRGEPEKLVLSGDGKYLAVLLKRRENVLLDTVLIVKADERRVIGVFVASSISAEKLRFLPNNRILTEDTSASGPRYLRLWQIPDERNRLVLSPPRRPDESTPDPRRARISQLFFDSTGDRMLTASLTGRIALYDARDGKTLLAFKYPASAWSARFSADHSRIVVAGRGDPIVFDVRNGKVLATLKSPNKLTRDDFGAADFSSNGKWIATCGRDMAVHIWDAKTYTLVKSLTGHTAPVYRCRFSGDGERLVTAASDHTARFWNVPEGKELAVLRGHTDEVTAAVASADGKRIVTASNDRTVRIWDAATGTILHILRGHSKQVLSAEWNNSGSRIVTTSMDGTVRLWDTQSSRAISILNEAPAGSIYASFSPDGQRIAIANTMGEATIIWVGASPEALIAHARTTLPRQLSRQELARYHLTDPPLPKSP